MSAFLSSTQQSARVKKNIETSLPLQSEGQQRYVIQRGRDLKTLTDRQVESFLIGTHSSAFCRF